MCVYICELDQHVSVIGPAHCSIILGPEFSSVNVDVHAAGMYVLAVYRALQAMHGSLHPYGTVLASGLQCSA